MTKADFLAQLDEILEYDAGTLTGDEVVKDLDGWDSLATLSFIAMVDEQLNLQLSGAQIAKAETVNDLVALVGDKVSG